MPCRCSTKVSTCRGNRLHVGIGAFVLFGIVFPLVGTCWLLQCCLRRRTRSELAKEKEEEAASSGGGTVPDPEKAAAAVAAYPGAAKARGGKQQIKAPAGQLIGPELA
ncbi:hypothetical protein SEVIR_1G062130v4 [Setaria viridis]